MAKCELNGVHWSRHKYKRGVCKRCGVEQKVMARATVNRRAKRKADRLAKKHLALSSARVPQV